MAANRKLSDRDVARLRDLFAEGRSRQELAAEFGVTPRHVGRLVNGQARPLIGGLDAAKLRAGSVADAVEQYLAGAELNAGDAVLAATARALASKLDGCAASESSASAAATPRLAGELVAVLERLRESTPREPDAVDLLKRRRAARLLAVAACPAASTTTDD